MSQTLKEYLQDLYISKKPTALLLGNGLGLSHPDPEFRAAFTYDGKNAEEKTEIPKFSCPEEYMGYSRINLLSNILKSYIRKHPPSESIVYEDITQFFDLFNDIYSINYDLITSWVILESNKNKRIKQPGYIVDGFSNKPLSYEDLIGRLESFALHRQVLFLHGAYHLYHYPENNIYEKITISKSSDQFTERSLKKEGIKADDLINLKLINRIEENFNHYFANAHLEDGDKKPIIVMESKWYYKKADIKENDYLKYAFNQFKKVKGDVFAYGCSFAKDDHLIEGLLKNQNLETFHIAIRQQSQNRKESLEKKIEHYKNCIRKERPDHYFPKINWIEIPESEKHLIWEFNQHIQNNIAA